MIKVFVPNRTDHDYSDAGRYGKVTFLTEGHLRRSAINSHRDAMADAIANSAPEDYIVITGLSILTALASAMFAAKHGRLNLLLWDHGCYLDCQLPVLVSGASHAD